MSALQALVFVREKLKVRDEYVGYLAESIFRDLISNGASTKSEIFSRVQPLEEGLGWRALAASLDLGVLVEEFDDTQELHAHENISNPDGTRSFWLYFVKDNGKDDNAEPPKVGGGVQKNQVIYGGND